MTKNRGPKARRRAEARLSDASYSSTPRIARPPMVSVCGVMGGAGTTTVACSLWLASRFEGRGARPVAIVDLDVRNPGVLRHLGPYMSMMAGEWRTDDWAVVTGLDREAALRRGRELNDEGFAVIYDCGTVMRDVIPGREVVLVTAGQRRWDELQALELLNSQGHTWTTTVYPKPLARPEVMTPEAILQQELTKYEDARALGKNLGLI